MTSSAYPPGPKGHWLAGSLRDFRHDTLGFLTACARKYGDTSSFRLGPHRYVFFAHPTDIEQVLVTQNSNFPKHYVIELLRPSLGNGLLTSEGETWKRQRRLIQPAFLRDRLLEYVPELVSQTEQMLRGWENGQQHDIHADMMRLTLSLVTRTLMDVDLNDHMLTVERATSALLDDFTRRYHSLVSLPVWVPTRRNRTFTAAMGQLDQLVQRLIDERRTASEQRTDLLSRLIDARDADEGRGMSDRQLRDELVTLLLAGHETTANALAWTWYLLAQNPDIAAKLHQELDDVLGGRAPIAADLPRLKYTEWTIRESMRLYPPAYAIGRRALRGCRIGEWSIPAGTTILLSQWVTQRDARFFENPEDFRPERWGETQTRELPKYAYFPFGGGPRVCIGNAFALLEAICVLATTASRFHVELVPDQHVEPWP